MSSAVVNYSNQNLIKIPQDDVKTASQASVLILDKNKITRLENLESFSALQQLSISENRINRLQGLTSLRHLTVLNLPNNSITSIEGLNSLSKLTWLNLSANQIKVMSNLHNNVNLRHLDLSDNAIAEIGDVHMLMKLRTLLLHGNRLTHLTAVARLLPPTLEILSLAENFIYDLNEISHLSDLEKLDQLSIMHNPCIRDVDFCYRAFVVNWCHNLRILDGRDIHDKESLQAEWLFSQGKGRHFVPGQHVELCEYLHKVFPLSSAKDEENKKLEKIREKQRLYQNEAQQQSKGNLMTKPSSPMFAKAAQRNNNSSTRDAASACGSETAAATATTITTVVYSPSQVDNNNSTWADRTHSIPIPQISIREFHDVVDNNNASDYQLRRPTSLRSSNYPPEGGVYMIPPSPPDTTVISTQRKSFRRHRTYSRDSNSPHLKSAVGGGGLSMSPPTNNEMIGLIYQKREDVMFDEMDSSHLHHLHQHQLHQQQQHLVPSRFSAGIHFDQRASTDQSLLESESRYLPVEDDVNHLEDSSLYTNMNNNTATSIQSIRNPLAKSVCNDTISSSANGVRKATAQDHAAALVIQRVWRGYRCRETNPRVRRWLKEKTVNRLRQHVTFLEEQMRGYYRMNAEERRLRMLHTQALEALLKEVDSLKSWKASVVDELSTLRSQTSQINTQPMERTGGRESLSLVLKHENDNDLNTTLHSVADPFTSTANYSTMTQAQQQQAQVQQSINVEQSCRQLENEIASLHQKLENIQEQVKIEATIKQQRLNRVRQPGLPLPPERLRWLMPPEEFTEGDDKVGGDKQVWIEWDPAPVIKEDGALDYHSTTKYTIFVDSQERCTLPANECKIQLNLPDGTKLYKIEVRASSELGESYLSSPLYWQAAANNQNDNRRSSDLSICSPSNGAAGGGGAAAALLVPGEPSQTPRKSSHTDNEDDANEHLRFIEEARKIIDLADSDVDVSQWEDAPPSDRPTSSLS